jgi:gluconolactonase
MFAAPPEITAAVLTRLPDALRRAGHPADWAHGRQVHSFLEGPVFDREGHLCVVDIPHGRIFRISAVGEWQLLAAYDGWPNGLALRADGKLAIADHKRGLLLLDPASGLLEPLLVRCRREAFRGLNDLIFSRAGDLYFTDQGETGLQDPSGRLYRLRAEGRLEMLLGGVPSPNGLVLTPDEDILYLAVTRANQIWRVPLLEDGGIGRVGVFLQLQGGLAGPDGLAMDAAGNLAIAHNGLGTAWLVSRLGEPLLRVRSPEGLTLTNLTFGPDQRLYMTESESGTVLAADVSPAGAWI